MATTKIRNEQLDLIESESLESTVAFYAYPSVAQNISDGTNTTVEFDTADFDLGSDFNTTTDRFVAPVAGIYSLTAKVGYSSIPVDSRALVQILVNGNLRLSGEDLFIGGASGSKRMEIYATGILSLSASDYVQVRTYQLSGGTEPLANNKERTYFCGYLVGTT